MKNAESQKITAFDGLRGLGACAIAFFRHYDHFEPEVSPLKKVFPVAYTNGWLAVEMFFMLSGFVMMLGWHDRIREDETTFSGYLGKRLYRIYPLHFFSLILVVILESWYVRFVGIPFVYLEHNLYRFWLNVFCIQTGIIDNEFSCNGPAWFISVIMLMYVIFYLVVKNTKSENRLYFWMTILAFYGVRLVVAAPGGPLLCKEVGRGLSCFFIGALLAVGYKKKIFERMRFLVWGSALIALISYIVIRVGQGERLGNVHLLVILCISPAVILAAVYLAPVRFVLNLKPFLLLGKISTGIYLMHFPVQCLWEVINQGCGLKIDYSAIWIWALYAVSVILVAIGSTVFTKWAADRVIENYKKETKTV